VEVIRISLLHLKRIIKYKAVIIGCLTIPALIVCAALLLTKGKISTNQNSSICIANNDSGSYGQILISQFKKDKNTVIIMSSSEDAPGLVEKNDVDAAVIIPEDFSMDIVGGTNPEVKVYRLANTNTYTSVVNTINSFISKNIISSKAVSASKNKISMEDITQEMANKSIKLDVASANPSENVPLSRTLMISFSVSFLMFTMIYIVNELNSLRASRTLRRCLSTPHRPVSIAASLILPFLMIGWIQILIMIVLPSLIFNMSLGKSYAALFIVYTALIAVTMSLGLLISRFASNVHTAPIIVNMIVTITCTLGGSFMPLNNMPAFMQKIALFTPQNWAVTALNKIILHGAGLMDVLPEIGVLVLFALAFLTASASSIKKLSA
jgi:ABC-type multidrug transport system, permease component